MEAADALGAATYPKVGLGVGAGLGLVVIRTSFQTKFQPAWFGISVVLNYSCYVVLGLNWPRSYEVSLYPRIRKGCNL